MNLDLPSPTVCVDLDDLKAGRTITESTENEFTLTKLNSLNSNENSSVVYSDLSSRKKQTTRPFDLQTVDFLGPSEVIKDVLSLPYLQRPSLFAVHRVGNTLLLDSVANSDENDYNIAATTATDFSFPENTLSISNEISSMWPQGGDMLKYRMEGLLAAISPTMPLNSEDAGVLSTENPTYSTAMKPLTVPTSANQSVSLSQLHIGSPYLPPPGYFIPRSPQPFKQLLLWQFHEMRLAVGSDLTIYRTDTHPAITIKPLDTAREIKLSTCLDFYLDNVMANIPELAICLHAKGFIRGMRVIPTEDIPYLSSSSSSISGQLPMFDPRDIDISASTILRFLQENCRKDESTYILKMSPNNEALHLYDLTSMSVHSQRKWKWMLAMVSYRFAIRLGHHTKMGSAVTKAQIRHRQHKLFMSCYELLGEIRQLGGQGHETIRAAVLEHLADIHLKRLDDYSSNLSRELIPPPPPTDHTGQGVGGGGGGSMKMKIEQEDFRNDNTFHEEDNSVEEEGFNLVEEFRGALSFLLGAVEAIKTCISNDNCEGRKDMGEDEEEEEEKTELERNVKNMGSYSDTTVTTPAMSSSTATVNDTNEKKNDRTKKSSKQQEKNVQKVVMVEKNKKNLFGSSSSSTPATTTTTTTDHIDNSTNVIGQDNNRYNKNQNKSYESSTGTGTRDVDTTDTVAMLEGMFMQLSGLFHKAAICCCAFVDELCRNANSEEAINVLSQLNSTCLLWTQLKSSLESSHQNSMNMDVVFEGLSTSLSVASGNENTVGVNKEKETGRDNQNNSHSDKDNHGFWCEDRSILETLPPVWDRLGSVCREVCRQIERSGPSAPPNVTRGTSTRNPINSDSNTENETSDVKEHLESSQQPDSTLQKVVMKSSQKDRKKQDAAATATSFQCTIPTVTVLNDMCAQLQRNTFFRSRSTLPLLPPPCPALVAVHTSLTHSKTALLKILARNLTNEDQGGTRESDDKVKPQQDADQKTLSSVDFDFYDSGSSSSGSDDDPLGDMSWVMLTTFCLSISSLLLWKNTRLAGGHGGSLSIPIFSLLGGGSTTSTTGTTGTTGVDGSKGKASTTIASGAKSTDTFSSDGAKSSSNRSGECNRQSIQSLRRLADACSVAGQRFLAGAATNQHLPHTNKKLDQLKGGSQEDMNSSDPDQLLSTSMTSAEDIILRYLLQAECYLEASLTIFREVNDVHNTATVMCNLCSLYRFKATWIDTVASCPSSSIIAAVTKVGKLSKEKDNKVNSSDSPQSIDATDSQSNDLLQKSLSLSADAHHVLGQRGVVSAAIGGAADPLVLQTHNKIWDAVSYESGCTYLAIGVLLRSKYFSFINRSHEEEKNINSLQKSSNTSTTKKKGKEKSMGSTTGRGGGDIIKGKEKEAIEALTTALRVFSTLRNNRQKAAAHFQLGALYASIANHSTSTATSSLVMTSTGTTSTSTSTSSSTTTSTTSPRGLELALIHYEEAHRYYAKYDIGPTFVLILIDMVDIYLSSFVAEAQAQSSLLGNNAMSSQCPKTKDTTTIHSLHEIVHSMIGGAFHAIVESRFAFTPAVRDRYGAQLELLAIRVCDRLANILIRILQADAKGLLLPSVSGSRSNGEPGGTMLTVEQKQFEIQFLKDMYSSLIKRTASSGDSLSTTTASAVLSTDSSNTTTAYLYSMLEQLHRNRLLEICF